MKYKQVQYMIIREEQANVMLIEKLRSFRKYINEDMSDWEQLIAVGGFIADVIRLIKWDKYRKLFSTSSSLCDASSTRVIFSATCSLTGDANSSLCCAGTDSNSSIISSARKGLSNRSVSLEVYSSATKSKESPTTSPKRK